jgi:uncharacterized protein
VSDKNADTAALISQPFVVMAKPVGPLCNLGCSYCYYLDTARLYNGAHQFRMKDELLESYIRQYLAASQGPAVLFVWHGGEPTLAGLDFFRRAVELQKKYLPAGWTCWNNLQTNGLLLDDEWCSFLAGAHFDVGVSIDGTRRLHDACRKDHRGQDSYERTAAAVRRLQAHGLQPDLLCVVNSSTAGEPLNVYRALRDFKSGWIQFIPLVRSVPGGQVSPDSVSAQDYGQFLISVFNQWVQQDLGKLNVQFLAEMMLVYSGGRPNVCWMAPTCGRVVVLEHDGSLYSCDHFVNPAHRIGDLNLTALSEMVDSPEQQRFGREKRDLLPAPCRVCAWLAVCNGGCPKDRLMAAPDGGPPLNYLCSGLSRFYAYAGPPLQKVVQLMKEGRSFESIRAEMRQDLLARWKGVGRNDPCPCGSGRKAKNCCWDQRP